MFLVLSIEFEFLALVLHNQAPSSNLNYKTGYHDGGVFLVSLQGNPKTVL
jgi:hypothetical protein